MSPAVVDAPAPANTEHAPFLRGVLLCAVAAATLTTGVMGLQYWIERNDPVMAVVTVIAECVSACGLPVATATKREAPGKAVVGLALVIAAALVCGATTWAKLDGDARSRAEMAMQASPFYAETFAALASVNAVLRDELGAQPPNCTCPATIAAWRETQRARVELLTTQRAGFEDRLISLQPAVTVSTWDVGRSLFLELVKLLGVFAFSAPPRMRSEMGAQKRRLRRAGALGALAMLQGAALTDDAGVQGAQLNGDQDGEYDRAGRVRQSDAAAIRAARRAQARALALDGVPKTEIARRLGVHRNTVHNWLRLA